MQVSYPASFSAYVIGEAVGELWLNRHETEDGWLERGQM